MIETGRLILRAWANRDRAPFAEMSADSEVMKHLDGAVDQEASDAIIDRLIAADQADGHTFWAVECKEDRALLGFCGLRRGGHAETPVPDVLEIGWRLARHAWGKGYAREAAAASLDWGWANRDDPFIAAWTVPANTASWGLMVRLGMIQRPEFDFKHPRFAADHPLCQHLVYTIDRPQ